jgi:hypothetical protein
MRLVNFDRNHYVVVKNNTVIAGSRRIVLSGTSAYVQQIRSIVVTLIDYFRLTVCENDFLLT